MEKFKKKSLGHVKLEFKYWEKTLTFLHSVSLYAPSIGSWPKTIERDVSRQVVVLRINLSLSQLKWDKQFYLELAQLLPQQLLNFDFLIPPQRQSRVWKPLSPLLSHSCSGSAQVVEKFGQRRRRWNRRCSLVVTDVHWSPWPLNLELRPQWDQGMDLE